MFACFQRLRNKLNSSSKTASVTLISDEKISPRVIELEQKAQEILRLYRPAEFKDEHLKRKKIAETLRTSFVVSSMPLKTEDEKKSLDCRTFNASEAKLTSHLETNPAIYGLMRQANLLQSVSSESHSLREAFAARFSQPIDEPPPLTQLTRSILLSRGPAHADFPRDLPKKMTVGNSILFDKYHTIGRFLYQVVTHKVSNIIALGHVTDDVRADIGSFHFRELPKNKCFLSYFTPGTQYFRHFESRITVTSHIVETRKNSTVYALTITSSEGNLTQQVLVNNIHVDDNAPVILDDEEISALYDSMISSVLNPDTEKLLIHCAAGRGRTGNVAEGILEAISIIMPATAKIWFPQRRLEKNDELGTVEWLREKRPGSVNTPEQFISSRIIAAQLVQEHARRLRKNHHLAETLEKIEVTSQQNRQAAIAQLRLSAHKLFEHINKTLTQRLINNGWCWSKRSRNEKALNIRKFISTITPDKLTSCLEYYFDRMQPNPQSTEQELFQFMLSYRWDNIQSIEDTLLQRRYFLFRGDQRDERGEVLDKTERRVRTYDWLSHWLQEPAQQAAIAVSARGNR